MSQASPAADLASHRVFPAEIRGVALVVRPRGDAIEFTHGQISAEMKRLTDALDLPGVEHLILNLGGSNYYGSEMIGLFVQLGLHARETGGQSAMCELSEDMRGAMSVMHLDQLWLTFDTEGAAVRSLAGESSPPLLKNRMVWLATFVALVAAGLTVAFFLTRPTPDQQLLAYRTQIQTTWNEATSEQTSNLTLPQWKLFAAGRTRRMNMLMYQLEAEPLNDHAAAPHLAAAIRNGLLPLLADRAEPHVRIERSYEDAMQKANEELTPAE